MTELELFTKLMRLIEKTPTCWIWQGTLNHSRGKAWYGQITIAGRKVRAHRAVYQLLRGPIPEGLELDHLCRITTCVNPKHLEPVTHLENMRRSIRPAHIASGWKHKKAYRDGGKCKRGHTALGTYTRSNGVQECMECRRIVDRERRVRAKGLPG